MQVSYLHYLHDLNCYPHLGCYTHISAAVPSIFIFIYLFKEHCLKFLESNYDKKTPKVGWWVQWPKCCEYSGWSGYFPPLMNLVSGCMSDKGLKLLTWEFGIFFFLKGQRTNSNRLNFRASEPLSLSGDGLWFIKQ